MKPSSLTSERIVELREWCSEAERRHDKVRSEFSHHPGCLELYGKPPIVGVPYTDLRQLLALAEDAERMREQVRPQLERLVELENELLKCRLAIYDCVTPPRPDGWAALTAPASRATCSQCGQRWESSACGPTHAAIAAEQAGASE